MYINRYYQVLILLFRTSYTGLVSPSPGYFPTGDDTTRKYARITTTAPPPSKVKGNMLCSRSWMTLIWKQLPSFPVSLSAPRLTSGFALLLRVVDSWQPPEASFLDIDGRHLFMIQSSFIFFAARAHFLKFCFPFLLRRANSCWLHKSPESFYFIYQCNIVKDLYSLWPFILWVQHRPRVWTHFLMHFYHFLLWRQFLKNTLSCVPLLSIF